MIVMKFGGTSTKDSAAMMNVARIVGSSRDQHPIVVISAIAQATNMLEEAGKLAAETNVSRATEVLMQLFNRHVAIVDELISPQNGRTALKEHLSTCLEELKELVKGVSILRELTPRTLDAFYCYGELLSSRLVAAVLQEQGVNSAWVDTKEFMITDENYNAAHPMMELVEDRLRSRMLPLLQQGIVPVTQGFIGVTQNGNRTTMGRESSDYSAAIIGAALPARDVQIWTDVDGILTADPRVVASPKKVKVLSFEEAFELSFFGAKVLHPNTMLPAIEKNIPIHIYNSLRPHLPGTLVTSQNASNEPRVKSIAYKRNVVLLNIAPRKRFGQYIFWEHVYNILTKYNNLASLTVTSEYNLSIVLDNIKTIAPIVHELEEIGVVTSSGEKGIICIVGTNICNASHLLDTAVSSISRFGMFLISYGASNSSVTFLVDDADVPEAVQVLHRAFFESSHDPEIFEVLEHFSAATAQ